MTELRDAEALPRFFVQSLARGLDVLAAFDRENPRLTVADVSRITGLDRAVARRLVLTLVETGYLSRVGRVFSLNSKVLNLGYAYLIALSLPELAEPHLKSLASTLGESTYLSVRDGDDSVTVAMAPMRRIWSTLLTVGTRLPVLTTASGRVLLAGEPQGAVDSYIDMRSAQAFTPHTITSRNELKAAVATARVQGWAMLDQELEEGIRTMSAPVRDSTDAIVAAVSVSKLVGVSDIATTRDEILPHLLRAAHDIQTDYQRSSR